MKKILPILLIVSLFWATTNISAAKVIELTDEQQQKIDDAAKNAEERADKVVENNEEFLNQTLEARKQLILLAVDAALLAVHALEIDLKKSVYLTAEQKNELIAVTTKLGKTLEDYKSAVQKATTTEELYTVNKNMLKELNANKEEIRKTIAKVTMIGVSAALTAAEEYLKAAKNINQALKACGQNTAEVDQQIAKAEEELAELEKLTTEIMADSEITEDEYEKVKEAAKLAVTLSADLTEITLLISDLALSCPAVNTGIDIINNY